MKTKLFFELYGLSHHPVPKKPPFRFGFPAKMSGPVNGGSAVPSSSASRLIISDTRSGYLDATLSDSDGSDARS